MSLIEELANAMCGSGKAGKMGDNFSWQEHDKWIHTATLAIEAIADYKLDKEGLETANAVLKEYGVLISEDELARAIRAYFKILKDAA